jgi:hypothetical protein
VRLIDLAKRVAIASAAPANQFSSGGCVRQLSDPIAHGRLLVGHRAIAVIDDLGIVHVFVDPSARRTKRV